MNFIREFWEFLKIRKKYWLFADHNCASYFWGFNSVNSRISGCPVYLHHILEMKSILGISAFYHDSANCILIDGEINLQQLKRKDLRELNMIQVILSMQ